jgi:transcriptional regulator with XRE-family HTH domain
LSRHKQKLIKLGKRIEYLRGFKKMTLEELANKVSISKGNLSDIENGKKDPRYTTLQAIAEGIGIKVATLLREL